MKLKYNGKDYEANELLTELATRDSELAAKVNAYETLEGEKAAVDAEIVTLKEKVNKFDETLETVVTEKINTISEVAKLTGKESSELIKLNSADLKKEVINKAYEGMDLEGKSEAYIDGLYAGAVNKINTSTEVKPTPGKEVKEEKLNGFDRLNKAVNGGAK